MLDGGERKNPLSTFNNYTMRNYRTTLTSISTADPSVFTLVDHGLYQGDKIELETTGTLPTGLETDITYYVIIDGITKDTFSVSTVRDGEPVAVTAAGSGTHYFIKLNHSQLHPIFHDTR